MQYAKILGTPAAILPPTVSATTIWRKSRYVRRVDYDPYRHQVPPYCRRRKNQRLRRRSITPRAGCSGQVAADEIDLIIVATATLDIVPVHRDHRSTKLGIANGCPAFDVAVCAGFMDVLSIAVTPTSKVLAWRKRLGHRCGNVQPHRRLERPHRPAYYGDGGAVVLGASDEAGIIHSANSKPMATVSTCSTYLPNRQRASLWFALCQKMDGRAWF